METQEDFKRAYRRMRYRDYAVRLVWRAVGFAGSLAAAYALMGTMWTLTTPPHAAMAEAPSETHTETATGDSYASAYADCAAHGWDAGTVNACRWAAAMHFGGQHDLYYYIHHTTENN